VNQTAGLFGGLLIGTAILGAYVWVKVQNAGSFAAAFPQIFAALGGTGAASASSSSSPPFGTVTPDSPNSGGFGPEDPDTSDPNSGGFGAGGFSTTGTNLLSGEPYQLTNSANGGLAFVTSPSAGLVTLPGPEASQYSPPDLATVLASQGLLA
jgi:hypothetical protein